MISSLMMLIGAGAVSIGSYLLGKGKGYEQGLDEGLSDKVIIEGLFKEEQVMGE